MIELLVVIAIIGVLVGLLLPAIQAARELARLTQCQSHLKQIGLGMHQFHELHERFPMQSGFPHGISLAGRPTWVRDMVPFLEETAMLAIIREAKTSSAAGAYLMGMPIEVMNCPSRRPSVAYPRNALVRGVDVTHVARADYAINGGEVIGPSLPGHLETFSINNGIVQPFNTRAPVKFVQVIDGLSNTYLAGEKYVNADQYSTGLDPGDVQPMFAGPGYETARYGGQMLPPQQDQPGKTNPQIFGSAHPSTWNVLICDGSVHRISYSINPTTHGRLANRHDQQPIDDNLF